MIKKRLLALAKFLRKVPDKQFDLGTWRENNFEDDYSLVADSTKGYQITSAPSCGTTACAVGWGCAMPEFQKLGLKMILDPDEFSNFYPKFKEFTGFEAVSEFFGISDREARYIFTIDAYGDEPISAKDVAARIEKFVTESGISPSEMNYLYKLLT